jgi:hypothetical protein
MSVQWDSPERAGHFIRLLERESKAWHDAADAVQALLPGVSGSLVNEAESRIREFHARAEALRRLVLHICEGDYSLLTDPES